MTDTNPDDAPLHPRVVASHIHRLDARLLLRALPHIDQVDLFTVRRDFAQWVSGTRHGWLSWQAAWNTWTGAVPGRPGALRLVPARCGDCHGHRFDRRRGVPCVACGGTGKGRRAVAQTATWIPEPE